MELFRNYVIYFLLIICLKEFNALKPIVLVPGLGGSELEAKLNKTKSEHFYCFKHSDWYTLWVSFIQLEIEYCMIDNMKLIINETDGTTSNTPGVEIRVTKFGDTETMEILDPFHPIEFKKIVYFKILVDYLKKLNYVSNVSLRGAPYDFRKAPNEMGKYMTDLKALIEETYSINNNSEVILIGHSMGGTYLLYFLKHQTAEWKKKYVAGLITMGTPWGGSVKTLKAIISGDTLGISRILFNPYPARQLQRTMPSISWMLPKVSRWKDDEVLVFTAKRNYTVADYKQLFDDIKFDQGMSLRNSTNQILTDLDQPGVKTFCLYGSLEPDHTPRALIYGRGSKWFNKNPTVLYGPGDGSVNKQSLEVCKDWPDTTVMEFEGVNHNGILKDEDVLKYVENIIRQL